MIGGARNRQIDVGSSVTRCALNKSTGHLRPVNNHDTSRSYLPRNTDVRRFGALPAIFALLHHHIHTPQQGHTSHVPFTAHSTTAGSSVPPHETAKPAIPETTKSGTTPARICRQNKPHPHSNTHPFPSDYAGTPRSARFLYGDML